MNHKKGFRRETFLVKADGLDYNNRNKYMTGE